jgi:plasmid stabilization system protein ParE
MLSVFFHPEAQYHQAVAWYLQRNKRAAELFSVEVRRVVLQISTQPDRYPFFEEKIREAPLIRFPFSVLYSDNALTNSITVLAVAHSSREVGYWLDRT